MKKKSFTLVEIMIVVAIIAILAAIAVPSLTANRAQAVERTKAANIKMVKAAINSALAADVTAVRSDIDTFDEIKAYLDADITAESDLDVAGQSITISGTDVTYSASE